MKFHASVIEEIIKLCHNFGGHAEETKLRSHINQLVISPYVRITNEKSDSITLVETKQYIKEREIRRIPTNDILPMQLHSSVKEKIINIYKTYSGYNQETKLRKALQNIDMTPYESKTQGTNYLVLTEDYMKALRNKPAT